MSLFLSFNIGKHKKVQLEVDKEIENFPWWIQLFRLVDKEFVHLNFTLIVLVAWHGMLVMSKDDANFRACLVTHKQTGLEGVCAGLKGNGNNFNLHTK
jgi:hypothetical protein